MNVGAYLRISRDDEARARRGIDGDDPSAEEVVNAAIERQRQDCADLIQQERWDGPVEWFVDRDVSAYTDVVRPEFERVLDAISDGRVNALVVYHWDRLARQPMDAERLLKVVKRVGGVRFATAYGAVDLYSEQGEDMLRWQVMQAHAQSRATSRRVARKHRELAEQGKPVGGHRPFGLQADKVTEEPYEAEAIRNAVDRLLLGESSVSILREWNANGLTTSTGRTWVNATFRQMLKSPRLAGWRVYRDEIAQDRNGQPVRGQQAAILSPEKHEELLAVMAERARVAGQQPGKRIYLLSGVIRCGECGSRLSGNADRNATGIGSYSCKPSASSRTGCGRVAVTIGQADALVEGLILRRLAHRQVEAQERVWPGLQELRAVSGRRAEIMAAYNGGTLLGGAAFAMIAVEDDRQSDLMAEKRVWEVAQRRAATVSAADPDLWSSMSVDARRLVISAEIAVVAVHRSRTRGGSFDPSRIKVIWRQ